LCRLKRHNANSAHLHTASITDRLGNRSCYVYDAGGRVSAVTDTNEVTTRYGYDIMGRLNYVEEPSGTVVYYKYDKNGNMLQEITTDKTETFAMVDGSSNRRVVNYFYTPTGEMMEIGSGSETVKGGKVTSTLRYDTEVCKYQWRYPHLKDISIIFNTLYFMFQPIDCTIK